MDHSEHAVLPIQDMDQRHTGLTKAIADTYSEAARICLDRHHTPPASFEVVSSGSQTTANAEWQTTDSRTRHAWANDTDATEAGAYAFVLAAVELAQGLVAVRRAETNTGADYYVAAVGDDPEDLENCFRLEVSGVDRGSHRDVTRRLAAKLDQARRGNSNVPAIAGVVGFQARHIAVATVVDE